MCRTGPTKRVATCEPPSALVGARSGRSFSACSGPCSWFSSPCWSNHWEAEASGAVTALASPPAGAVAPPGVTGAPPGSVGSGLQWQQQTEKMKIVYLRRFNCKEVM